MTLDIVSALIVQVNGKILNQSEGCIHQLFETQVQSTPDAMAVLSDSQSLSYQDLNQKTNQLAHYLRDAGVSSGTLVGICVERSPNMIIGLLAILKAGAAYVPLEPDYPAERLLFILKDSQISIILTEGNLVQKFFDNQVQLIVVDADRALIDSYSSANPDNCTTLHDLMYVIYTSGSTGRPKGVMIPHQGIVNQLYWRQKTFPLTPDDRVLQNIAFSFDPSVWQIFWPLVCGAQIVLPRPQGHKDFAYLVDLIEHRQVSIIAVVPSMLKKILEQPKIGTLSGLRHVFCGGEPLTRDLQDKFFSLFSATTSLHNVYGPTEASIDASFWTCQRDLAHSTAPIGRPISNTKLHVLDDNFEPLTDGRIGELFIEGPGLAKGYLHRPELTSERFIPNPLPNAENNYLYKTGDLVRYLPDGNLTFVGRVDCQVKVRGFRIELEEIEHALRQNATVTDCVVTVQGKEEENKRIVAFVVLSRGRGWDTEALRYFLRKRLPDYMIPAALVQLDSLPLNTNGKIDRRALPVVNFQSLIPQSARAVPQSPFETKLTHLWQTILNISPIGINDNFFNLGGDSLLATQLVLAVKRAFHKELSVEMLIQAPTIQAMATLLQRTPEVRDKSPLILLQSEGKKLPLFCIFDYGQGCFYHSLIHRLGNERIIYSFRPNYLRGILEDNTILLENRIKIIAKFCLEEMLAVQPVGPYHLCGYCFGGLIAFEIACQVKAMGQMVSISLLDTFNTREKWYTRTIWQTGMRIADKIIEFLGNARHIQTLNLKQFGLETLSNPSEQCHTLNIPDWEKVASVVTWPGSYIKREIQFRTIREQVNQVYKPKTFTGPALLIRADQSPDKYRYKRNPELDNQLGWAGLLTGKLTTYAVPYNNAEMLKEPGASQISKALKDHLDSAEKSFKPSLSI